MKVLCFVILFAFASVASAEKPTSAPTTPQGFDKWEKREATCTAKQNKVVKIAHNRKTSPVNQQYIRQTFLNGTLVEQLEVESSGNTVNRGSAVIRSSRGWTLYEFPHDWQKMREARARALGLTQEELGDCIYSTR